MQQLALVFLAPLCLFAAGAAGPSIAGTWDVRAVDSRGAPTHVTLIVQQTGAQLSGSVRTDDGYDIPLIDPKFTAPELTFNLRINPTELVKVTLKLDTDRLDGKFEGTESGAGTIKATRVAAPNLSGIWTGEWEISPDGRPGPHYMVLKQDGDKIAGAVGPHDQQQIAIDHANFANGRLTFDVVIPAGNNIGLSFDFTVSADSMTGAALLKMNGTEKSLKLAAKRSR